MPTYRKPAGAAASKSAAMPKLQYNRKSYEQMAALAAQSSSGRNSYIVQDIKFYKGKDGDNRVRVLPPSWENAEHWGLDMFLHYGVGADNDAFLCRAKHNHDDGRCPICEMLEQATTDEERQQLKPKHRIGTYLISRDKQEDGVLFWAMPFNLDRDFIAAAMDKFTREYFPPDDITAGYDHVFTRTGTGDRTRYSSVQIARTPSPLHADSKISQTWVDYIVAKPISSILKFYDYDFIKRQLLGSAAEDKVDTRPTHVMVGTQRVDVTADVPERTGPVIVATAKGATVIGQATPVEEGYPTSEVEVRALSFDDAASLADALGLDFSTLTDEEALYKAIIVKLGVVTPSDIVPVTITEKSAADVLRERFAKLKK